MDEDLKKETFHEKAAIIKKMLNATTRNFKKLKSKKKIFKKILC